MPGLSGETTAQAVQSRLGQLARDVHLALKRSQDGVEFLNGFTDQELLSLYQIDANDAADLRAAFADLDQLWNIYRGANNGTLASPKNFRQTIRRIIGLGFV